MPEVIEDFFFEAAQDVQLKLTNNRNRAHIYHVGRLPKHLLIGARNLNRALAALVAVPGGRFDKALLADPSCRWWRPVTPLFEALRADEGETLGLGAQCSCSSTCIATAQPS